MITQPASSKVNFDSRTISNFYVDDAGSFIKNVIKNGVNLSDK